MHRAVTIELEEFATAKNTVLAKFINRAVLAYNYYKADSQQLLQVRNEFISQFSNMILERIPLPSAVALLTTKLYSEEMPTLLEQISYAFYRCYVEGSDETVQRTITKKILDKLNISPAKFIRRTKEISLAFKDFLTVRPYMEDYNVVLDFSLIF